MEWELASLRHLLFGGLTTRALSFAAATYIGCTFSG